MENHPYAPPDVFPHEHWLRGGGDSFYIQLQDGFHGPIGGLAEEVINVEENQQQAEVPEVDPAVPPVPPAVPPVAPPEPVADEEDLFPVEELFSFLNAPTISISVVQGKRQRDEEDSEDIRDAKRPRSEEDQSNPKKRPRKWDSDDDDYYYMYESEEDDEDDEDEEEEEEDEQENHPKRRRLSQSEDEDDSSPGTSSGTSGRPSGSFFRLHSDSDPEF